ncbi:MAG: deaminase, partial [bacterium]
TTGYNGAPSGVESSLEIGSCLRETLGIPSGQRFEICRGSHAEENAIVQGARFGISVAGATLYCTTQPCLQCAKMIINAGLTEVVYQHPYPHEMTEDFMRQAGVVLRHYDGNVQGPIPIMEHVTDDEMVRRLYTYANLPDDPNLQEGLEAASVMPAAHPGAGARPEPAYLKNKPVNR